MIKTNIISFLIFFFCISNLTFAQQKIPLYNSAADCDFNKKDNIVVTEGSTYLYEIETPELWYYPAEIKRENNTAVIVIPGGAYRFLSITNEGIQIIEWLNSIGIDAFMLKHRLPNNYSGSCKQIVATNDAFKAVELIRDNSEKWNIDKNKVGVIGFSAGGHLASSISTKGLLNLNKPDFSILVYPVITMDINFKTGTFNSLFGEKPNADIIHKYSNELNVNEQTPPTILIHSNNDIGTPPSNSIKYYQALRKNNIDASLHIWEDGGHGYGLGKGRGSIESWPKVVEEWMKIRNIIE
tara:strand:+ start:1420 stop:2310 length:891 start_codon:yes stop_codon:yes gene_type:complete